jgi:hypothetical protein
VNQKILDKIRKFMQSKKQKRAAGDDVREYCDGTVREQIVKQEVFRHKNGLGARNLHEEFQFQLPSTRSADFQSANVGQISE